MNACLAAPTQANEFFVNVMTGYRRAKALMVAHELGVFRTLAGGRLTPSEVARRIHGDLEVTSALLEALTTWGVLLRDGECFLNGPLAQRYLCPGQDEYVGCTVSYQNMMWEYWSELEDVVRTGRPRQHPNHHVRSRDQGFVRDYLHGLTAISARPARALADCFRDRRLESFLDVGSGPGVYAITLLEDHPELIATLFDVPESLAVASEMPAHAAHRERLRYQAGDYHSDALGADHDLILLSHLTHDEPPQVVERLCARAFDALRPGGTLAIHDWMLSPDAGDREWASFFSLHLMLYTNGGRLYPLETYRGWLEEAGFTHVRHRTLLAEELMNPTILLTAERP